MQPLSYYNAVENNERERLSILLRQIIWSVVIIITLTFAIASAIQPEHFYRYALIIALVCSVSFLALVIVKKGYIKRTAFYYIIFLMIMIFGFSWTGGGIKGHGMKILPIIVLLAGLTLGKKQIWIFGIIATLGGLVLVIADQYDLLPVKDPLGYSSLINWIYITTSIFLLCSLENLSVEILRKALHKSTVELELRKKSEEALRIKNEKLGEVAFLQSHIVRGPVANILGLIQLIRFDEINHPQNFEVIPKLEIVAKDLDAIIHQIVQKTGEIKDLPGVDGTHEK